MNITSEKISKIARMSGIRMASLLSIIFVWIYFSYHMIYGSRGYFVWIQKREMLSEKSQTLEALEKKHENLAYKSNLMQYKIDRDLLEQQVWKQLGYIEEDKIVIFIKNE